MRPIFICLLMLFSLGSLPLSFAQNDLPQLNPITFERELQTAMTDEGIEGVIVVLVEGDNVVYINGLGTGIDGMPLDLSTSYDIGRLAEPFLTTALLAIAEQGRLEPNIRLLNLLPNFTLSDARLAESITVANVMSHSAPLGNDENLAPLEAIPAASFRSVDPSHTRRRFSYCNRCTALLVDLANTLSNQPLPQFLEETLFYPLQMDNSHVEGNRIFSTPLEMARFISVHLQNGRWGSLQLVKPESINALHNRVIFTGRNVDEAFGYGWFIQPDVGLNVVEPIQDYLATAYDYPNHTAQLTVIPGYQRGVLLLTDQPTDGLEALMAIALDHFADYVPPQAEVPRRLFNLDGVYVTDDNQFLTITLVDEHLEAQLNGETSGLIWVDDRVAAFENPALGGTIFFADPQRESQIIWAVDGVTTVFNR